MRVAGILASLPLFMGLTACTPAPLPVPVEDAQVLCAQLALDRGNSSQPRVHMGVGLGTGRIRGGYGSIGISTDSLFPAASRNHEAFYRDCVVKRSGQQPLQSLYQQLGAKR